MSYAYPTKQYALDVLRSDPCYDKIEHSQDEKLVDMAWKVGKDAAHEIKARLNKTVIEAASIFGLTIERKNIDRVIGDTRYYCELITDKKKIIIYSLSVKLWAKRNDLSVEKAERLIIAHEYFHYLEATELGLTSKRYLVPMMQIGKIKMGKTGIKALSEIGAYAFSCEFCTEEM